jgi:hypothetical protein
MTNSPWSDLSDLALWTEIVHLAILITILVLSLLGFVRELRARRHVVTTPRGRWHLTRPGTIEGLGAFALLLSVFHLVVADILAHDILTKLGPNLSTALFEVGNLDAVFRALALGVGTASVGFAAGIGLRWMSERRPRDAESSIRRPAW